MLLVEALPRPQKSLLGYDSFSVLCPLLIRLEGVPHYWLLLEGTKAVM